MSHLHIVTNGGEDDGPYSRLRVEVMSNGFAGEGSALFSHSQILNFANALAVFPLSQEIAPYLEHGYSDRGEPDAPQAFREYVFVSVYPLGPLGELGVCVRLATSNPTPRYSQGRHTVEVDFRTTYQALSNFVSDLRHIAAGESWRADLMGR